MSYSLTAVLRLQDKMTAPLRKAMDQTKKMDDVVKKTSKSVGGYVSSTGKAASAVVKFAKENVKLGTSFGKVSAGVGSMRSGFVGLAAAIGGAYGAAKLFDATVGAASRRELDVITMDAMFKGDTKTANQFFAFLEKRAADSLFSENDFFSAKAFIPVTKDIALLEKIVAIQERLGASNMAEGMEGAAFAMREMFSSDATSMVERFNMPRKVLNEIKNLKLEDQLVALDRVLDEMGFTQDMLDRQDSTGIAMYRQGIDKLKLSLMRMGEQGLEKVKPLLEQFNRLLDTDAFDRFVKFGGDMLGDFFGGVVNAVQRASSYIDSHFINNPDFQNLPDIKQKIAFIYADLESTFKTWWDDSGKTKVEKVAREMGKTVASGLWNGMKDFAKDYPVLSALIAGGGAASVAPGPLPVKAAAGVTAGATTLINAGTANLDAKRLAEQAAMRDAILNPKGLTGPTAIENVKPANWFMQQYYRMTGGAKPDGSHATGLSRVPKNGYVAELHQGERVLTRSEADKQDRRGNGDVNVTITGPVNIRKESDIDAIARALAREVSSSLGGAAYA
ncbi:hypothetical protein FE782_03750 [Paenibacillus antri]|uniref:Tail tape measure protein n=1 Tax=Paenibacillus antri TaxID=2582848 RepID=A0A5R9GG54_9BACL|nr:hypothetical protein [Paenibacillus antri]TLS53396.1 hypothetical protein FE782_03750 [Paenibacillus antri]